MVWWGHQGMSRCRTVWSSTWYLEIHCSRKQEIRCFGDVLEKHLKDSRAFWVEIILLGTTWSNGASRWTCRKGKTWGNLLASYAKSSSKKCLAGSVKDIAQFLQIPGNQKRNMQASLQGTGEASTISILLMYVSTSISRVPENYLWYWLEHGIDCLLR